MFKVLIFFLQHVAFFIGHEDIQVLFVCFIFVIWSHHESWNPINRYNIIVSVLCYYQESGSWDPINRFNISVSDLCYNIYMVFLCSMNFLFFDICGFVDQNWNAVLVTALFQIWFFYLFSNVFLLFFFSSKYYFNKTCIC